jgi:alpha-D-ribose 1-methylphosphonate 5-triphosphate synthase subunit PhnI
VDDFGVKYVGREHAEHLMACIRKKYNISSDWDGGAYCGSTLDCDYRKLTFDLSMPGYIKAAFHKHQHPAPARPEHAPHTWNPPIYGANAQFVNEATTSPALSDKDVNKLQQLTGTLLYYARAVDPTLIMPTNVLASEQSNATEVTADKVIKLLNYCNTHPEIKIPYHASDMILHIHSDASYLSEN